MNNKKSAEKEEQKKESGKSKKPKKRIQIESDGLFKSIMEDKVAAREFLAEYLPANLQSILDLNKITVEKESYIEDDLKKKFSDIVYSVDMKSDKINDSQESDKAFIYILLEQQSKSDYWMALRLWKYILLLCERHKQKRSKLPLVVPIVFYNGKEKYTAPCSFWQLFNNPDMAKQLIGDEYKLIDLQAKTDEEIKRKQHLGLMEFFLKHIHQRDMLKLWERFMTEYSDAILLDKKNGYIYIKKLLWYTNTKVAEENKEQLNKLILEYLPTKDGETIMRSIADSYFEKGIEKGFIEGSQQGEKNGFTKGATNKAIEIAINMFRQNLSFDIISSVTGLSSDEIAKLKK